MSGFAAARGAASAAAVTGRGTAGEAGGRPRALVVDDRPEEAALFAKYLRAEGHDVVVAHSHAAAEEVLRGFDADYVLLDIDFAGDRETSFVFARSHPGLPVVFMSSLRPDEIPWPAGATAERRAFLQKAAALGRGVKGFAAAVLERLGRGSEGVVPFDVEEIPAARPGTVRPHPPGWGSRIGTLENLGIQPPARTSPLPA